MKKISLLLLAIFLALPFSCKKEDLALTEDEIIAGLKEALTIGANNSAAKVSAMDGYFKDQIIKILLPPEANLVVETVNNNPALFSALGVSQMIDDVILGINRSAEDAAKQVAPIFVNAITNMTIDDGKNILYGSDSAATNFLRINTFTELKNLFKPKMDSSLSKPVVGSTSAKSLYSNLTSTYNNVANSIAGQIAGINPVTNTDLTDYVTGKGLNGVFIKVADEELKIRKDPAARVTDLLEKVFGELD